MAGMADVEYPYTQQNKFAEPDTYFSILMVFSIDSRMAYLQARWQISVKSAPENLAVALAISSMSTSLAMGDLRKHLLDPFAPDTTCWRSAA